MTTALAGVSTTPRLRQPAITQLSVDPGRWRLDEYLSVATGGRTLCVPAGFVSDLASVPRWFWWLIAPFELSIVAALVHDWLYEHAGWIATAPGGTMIRLTRAEADEALYDLAAQAGVWWWRRRAAYLVVRCAARSAWKAAA